MRLNRAIANTIMTENKPSASKRICSCRPARRRPTLLKIVILDKKKLVAAEVRRSRPGFIPKATSSIPRRPPDPHSAFVTHADKAVVVDYAYNGLHSRITIYVIHLAMIHPESAAICICSLRPYYVGR
jgi:hypothetical protein